MKTFFKSNAKIGKRIRKIRKSLSMTQPELASALGVSQGTISNIERGIRANIPLSKLLQALGVSLKEIV